MLNWIWAGFFIVAFVCAGIKSVCFADFLIWNELGKSLFDAAKLGFSISINLTGLLCFWLGILKIAELSGATDGLAKLLRPLFAKIFPDVPQNSPAFGSIIMNMAANMLGLDNAATPMGLKAMEQLQDINPHKDNASSAQIMFIVLNASAVTLIPITILMYRMELGSLNPSAVFVPILIATFASTLVGFLAVAFSQKLNIFNKVVLSYLLIFIGLILALALGFYGLPVDKRLIISSAFSNFVLIAIIVGFIILGLRKKLNVYDTFILGAKEGFSVAVKIIPYLVAMLTAIAVLRASGALDFLILGLEKCFAFVGCDTDFVAALPTALMKPLSGSGARAMMIETMQNFGADSFPAFVSCIVQGSTETTFYVLALYFGAVKISQTGAALPCALLADLAGIIVAIFMAYLFY